MAHPSVQYVRYIYLDTIFMPEGFLKYQVKHEGPIKAQTNQQYHLQRQIAFASLPELDTYRHNTTRAHLQAQTKQVGSSVNQFRSPFIAQDPLAYSGGESVFIARPDKSVLNTDHIPDNIWYSKDFQFQRYAHNGYRVHMDILEVAYIAAHLASHRRKILEQYRWLFEYSRHSDDTVLRVIDEVKWRAKEGYWSQVELDLLKNAYTNGDRDAGAVFARFIQQWPLYPKTLEEVRRKWREYVGHAIPPPYPPHGVV